MSLAAGHAAAAIAPVTVAGLALIRCGCSQSSKESDPNARIARIENLVLIALTLKRPNVAPGLVLFVRTRHSALIGLQQITFAIGAAAGVACVNG
jgi:hypothetical protein